MDKAPTPLPTAAPSPGAAPASKTKSALVKYGPYIVGAVIVAALVFLAIHK